MRPRSLKPKCKHRDFVCLSFSEQPTSTTSGKQYFLRKASFRCGACDQIINKKWIVRKKFDLFTKTNNNLTWISKLKQDETRITKNIVRKIS